MDEPEPALVERVTRALGPLAGWRTVPGGYSTAQRWIVTCADGSQVSVTGAPDDLPGTWLRREPRVYAQVRAPFLPAVHAWDDDGDLPVLVLDDLSGAVWHAPWTSERITRVLETLQQVAATPPPAALPTLEAQRPMFTGWAHVAREPRDFLGLRLCSAAWLSPATDTLVPPSAEAPPPRDDLPHFDVRGHNLR